MSTQKKENKLVHYREPKRPLDPVIYALRKRRYDLNLSGPALAERMGYAGQIVAGWECGSRKPNYRSLMDWCKALGVELTIHVPPEGSDASGD